MQSFSLLLKFLNLLIFGIYNVSVAKEILFTFNQVFGDVNVTESAEPENENTLDMVDEYFFDFDVQDSLFACLPR